MFLTQSMLRRVRGVLKPTGACMDLLPGHAGVRCVDRADSLASKSPITGPLAVGRTDKLRTVRDILIKREMSIKESTRLGMLTWETDYRTISSGHKQV